MTTVFTNPKPIIGVIHVAALPGTPANTKSVAEIVAAAQREAAVYAAGKVDGIIVENMHDTPYLRGAVGPEITAAMTLAAQAVKAESGLPVGIQILAGANLEALAVAHAAGLQFVRVEGFAFAHVADEGLIESSAARLLRYRKMIGADGVQVWADVKKKHSSHAITADIGLGATAEAAEFMRADAVIVTGAVTGDPPQSGDVQAARQHCRLPIILGSGVAAENIARFYPHADGFIIGTYFKQDGNWTQPVEARRVAGLMQAVEQLR